MDGSKQPTRAAIVVVRPVIDLVRVEHPLNFLMDASGTAAEWEALADRCHASPFLRPGWLHAWWESFGKGTLEILTLRRGWDGRLVGLLPLRRLSGALLSPTNWHSPQFGLLVEDGEAAEALMCALFRDRPRRVDLRFLDHDAAGQLGIQAMSEGYHIICRTIQRSPYVTIDGDWDSYQRGIGKKVRSELLRRRRRLEQEGRLVLAVEDGGVRLEELLAEGLRVEAAGWKTEQGTAIGSHPETRRFYTRIARWADTRGWLRLAFLRLEGRALAFDFCLEYDRVHYLLKTGYDPAYRQLGPGKLIRYEMLARAFRSGMTSYEFLGADEPWKLEWTQMGRERQVIQAFRPSPLGVLDWSAHAHGQPLAKRVADRMRWCRSRGS